MFAEAKLYSNYSTCQLKKLKAMLTLYEDRLRWKIDEVVVDIGCGPGLSTSYLAKILPEEVSTIVSLIVQLTNLIFSTELNCILNY